MAQINGSKVLIWIGTSSASPTSADAVAFTTNCSLSITHDLPDATTKDSAGWAEHISGLRSWEVTVDGLTSFGENDTDFWTLVNTRDTVRMAFAVDGTGTYFGEVSCSGLELTNDMEASATFSGTLTGNGPLSTTNPWS